MAVSLMAASCEKVPYEEQQRRQAAENAMRFLRDKVMSTYYYWNRYLVKKPISYETDIYDYFDDLLYEKDHWSWMMDGKTYMDNEIGIKHGTYGVSLGQMIEYYKDYGVFVKYVLPDGPFDKAGVKRGWEITGIDNIATGDYIKADAYGLSNLFNYPSTTTAHLFTFLDPEGETHDFSIVAAESLNYRPALIKTIFTAADYPGLKAPVGYFNYLSFKADDDSNGKSMIDDISEPMEYFRANNIKTLILDLRYNGGGDSRASDTLVSYLAPKSAVGKPYVIRTHNDQMKRLDTTCVVKRNLHSPNFEKIYVITGEGSASASEMVLNGLKPLANIQHVGDTTYGKPNGMYVFLYPNHLAAYDRGDYSALQYVFLPICFYNNNGEGKLIPDDGMIPDNTRPDDLYHDFGPGEDNIGACLYHIVHGTYPSLPEVTPGTKTSGGIDARLDEWKNDKNYGRYTLKRDF